MAGPKKPKEAREPKVEILAETVISEPASKPETSREEMIALIKSPQLPSDFVERVMHADMRDAEGKELKMTALLMCSNIDVLLQRTSRIPALSELEQGLRAKLQGITGTPLYEQIGRVLGESDDATRLLTKKATGKQQGADYLQNTADGPGTPRVDMEDAMKALEKMRSLHAEIQNLGSTELYQERSAEVQRRMNEGDTQFMARFKMQKNLEGQITHALKQGQIDEETAQLVLFASSGQMNMAFNTVGQVGMPLSLRLDEYDLGENEAERRFYLLNTYWQLLGVAEGVRFLKRFYA